MDFFRPTHPLNLENSRFFFFFFEPFPYFGEKRLHTAKTLIKKTSSIFHFLGIGNECLVKFLINVYLDCNSWSTEFIFHIFKTSKVSVYSSSQLTSWFTRSTRTQILRFLTHSFIFKSITDNWLLYYLPENGVIEMSTSIELDCTLETKYFIKFQFELTYNGRHGFPDTHTCGLTFTSVRKLSHSHFTMTEIWNAIQSITSL